jgi:hypothetical protein
MRGRSTIGEKQIYSTGKEERGSGEPTYGPAETCRVTIIKRRGLVISAPNEEGHSTSRYTV